jgi:hypothetical protein
LQIKPTCCKNFSFFFPFFFFLLFLPFFFLSFSFFLSLYMFISILYMFRATMCLSSGENNCINTTPGICHSVWMTVWYAGWDEYSLHVSGNHVPIIGRNNCINTTPGICHSVWMTVWYAGWNLTV